ncbi:hypothetical protein KHC28_14475 [Ancylobacter sonchi]|uniref:hypothetical protein n=1 Tax=Ancylobacter sonchi TaxID=1937790 RepID=UPI001BD66774|nr:hypothetical protein [Ancylobacter sonchi]MBS7534861.1 hypothetical protein [Ancylobacter sonchi]
MNRATDPDSAPPAIDKPIQIRAGRIRWTLKSSPDDSEYWVGKGVFDCDYLFDNWGGGSWKCSETERIFDTKEDAFKWAQRDLTRRIRNVARKSIEAIEAENARLRDQLSRLEDENTGY